MPLIIAVGNCIPLHQVVPSISTNPEPDCNWPLASERLTTQLSRRYLRLPLKSEVHARHWKVRPAVTSGGHSRLSFWSAVCGSTLNCLEVAVSWQEGWVHPFIDIA